VSAKALYEKFRGEVSRRFVQTGIRYATRWLTKRGQLNILIPADLAIIGHMNAFEYDCVRDGKLVKARHAFTPGCRPYLAVGDGRGEVFILGTAYRFTDRGFIDYNTQGEAVEYNEKSGQIKKLRE
jgi:hypothetical protein